MYLVDFLLLAEARLPKIYHVFLFAFVYGYNCLVESALSVTAFSQCDQIYVSRIALLTPTKVGCQSERQFELLFIEVYLVRAVVEIRCVQLDDIWILSVG